MKCDEKNMKMQRSMLLRLSSNYVVRINKRNAQMMSNDEVVKSPHTPVLLEESIQALEMRPGETLLDMTFGAGGHTKAALAATSDINVLALDRDPVACEHAHRLAALSGSRVKPLHGKFSDLSQLLAGQKVDAVLLDLGCSSMQFDMAERGFSVSKDGPLDMRMDQQQKLTAADVIAYASEHDLANIFKIYGEEKLSKEIARAVIEARFRFEPLTRTGQLCSLVSAVAGHDYRQDMLMRRSHVATKVFQALRIFVNNEVNELNFGLILAHKFLRPGGRIVAISFHSIEDRIVKRHLQGNVVDNAASALSLKFASYDSSVSEEEMQLVLKKACWLVTTKPVLPSYNEILQNPRARSAKLRAAIKI